MDIVLFFQIHALPVAILWGPDGDVQIAFSPLFGLRLLAYWLYNQYVSTDLVAVLT